MPSTHPLLAALGLTLLLGSVARADLNARAVIVSSPAGAGHHYDLTLTNAGDTTVGTFWYAWVPGQDYLPSLPTAVQSPAGWTSSITHAGASDGYALEWIASSPARVAPGDTLGGFAFDSPDAPAAVNGLSPFFDHPPVGTSYVYSAGPFSDLGYQFVVAAVPEPGSVALLLGGATMALLRRRTSRHC